MKETIALIDDDRNILTSLSIALEKEGFKVQTYLDGESALIGLARTPPDLAVIDVKMPKMDGEELLKKLKCNILLQIHDELIFEVIEEEVNNYSKIIKDEMSSVKDSDLHSFSLPLSVDINVGDNWDDLH